MPICEFMQKKEAGKAAPFPGFLRHYLSVTRRTRPNDPERTRTM